MYFKNKRAKQSSFAKKWIIQTHTAAPTVHVQEVLADDFLTHFGCDINNLNIPD